MRKLLVAVLALVTPLGLLVAPMTSPVEAAQFLDIVQVDTDVYCLFSPTCSVLRTDTMATFPVPGMQGQAVLYTSTFVGSPGSAGEGWHGYEYRIDLSNVVGVLSINCINAMRIKLGGPSVVFDYDGNGMDGDEVYVITSGGPGSLAPKLALKEGDFVTFFFDPPVCAGSSPGTGDSSFVFGVAAAGSPRAVLAGLQPEEGGLIQVGARAPNISHVTSCFCFAPLYVLIANLPQPSLVGPTPKAREGRRQAMLNNVDAALGLEQDGLVLPAVQILERLLSLMDGVGQDWVQDDPATREDERAQLSALVQEIIESLSEER